MASRLLMDAIMASPETVSAERLERGIPSVRNHRVMLDADLAAVSAYNSTHPGATLGVKLRVWAANDAPEWAKTMDGNPVTVSGADTDGQWWQPDYRQAPPRSPVTQLSPTR